MCARRYVELGGSGEIRCTLEVWLVVVHVGVYLLFSYTVELWSDFLALPLLRVLLPCWVDFLCFPYSHSLLLFLESILVYTLARQRVLLLQDCFSGYLSSSAMCNSTFWMASWERCEAVTLSNGCFSHDDKVPTSSAWQRRAQVRVFEQLIETNYDMGLRVLHGELRQVQNISQFPIHLAYSRHSNILSYELQSIYLWTT
jgi:hypothetical protein